MTRANLVAAVVGCSYFMQNLDGTIVTTALPQIAESMDSSPVRLSIVVTAYLLSLAVFVPISGWLADRLGARTVFQAAIAIFTLGSALCGFSSNLVELTASRVLQGIGGALVVPVGRLVVLRTATRSEILQATVFMTVPAQIGAVVGPLVGGLITTYFSWRWIFLINIPIGILGLVLAALYIEDYREVERRPFDWLGFLYTGASLSCLMYGLDGVGHQGTSAIETMIFLSLGAVLGTLAVRHLRRKLHPLLNLSLFTIPTFATSIWGGSLFRVGWGALPFLLPLLFQVVFGMNAFASGLLVFASAVGSVMIRTVGPMIFSRFGFRTVLIRIGIIASFTMLGCGFLTPAIPPLAIFAFLLIGGVFQSLQIAGLNTLGYADVEPERMSGATGISQMTWQLGKALGVAVAAALLNASLAWHSASQLTGSDFLVAFAGIAIVSLASVPFFFHLSEDAGSEVSGYRKK